MPAKARHAREGEALSSAPAAVALDSGSSTVTSSAQPEDRGSVTIAHKVVERVAGHAVTLVPDAAAAPRRFFGINVGEAQPDGAAHVAARVHGSKATVEATIGVRWPKSVREVAEQTRKRIRDDVRTITGVEVDAIDLDVVSMNLATPNVGRVQ